MAKKLTSVVGIDIGSQKIKIVELRSKGREPEVAAIGIADTPDGAVDHTGVYNSDAVGDAVKQLLSQCGSTVNQALIAISGQASVLVRTLEVPRMNEAELKEHMQWEINRNIPFAESNVISDFRALYDEDPNSPNMDVVMAIAPQSAVDTLIACTKRAGRQPVGIDVEPLAIARSLQVSYAEEFENQVVCVVDMGHKTTSINIYRSGKLLMPRQIPIGGENFTKAIADSRGISMEEAEALKVSKAVIPESAIEAAKAGGLVPSFGMPPMAGDQGETQQFAPYNPFSDEPVPEANPFAEPEVEAAAEASVSAPATVDPFAIPEANPFEPVADTTQMPVIAGDPETLRIYNAFASVAEEFIAEVRRSIDYFRSRGGEVNHVLLASGATLLKGLPEYLGASIGLDTSVYDPFKNLTINERRVSPEFIAEHKQEFVIAVGTALHIFYD